MVINWRRSIICANDEQMTEAPVHEAEMTYAEQYAPAWVCEVLDLAHQVANGD